ncbi:MAG TPA: phosphodiester glycosidase family protein [Kofleriaceae bacterium]|nr:phosphodiester glycosidase family protein [Kofleriaceae bacterium]
MARALVSSLALAFAGVAAAPTAALAADAWSDPYPGVRRLHRTTSDQNINVLVVDLCAPGVSVRATATGERQRSVPSFGALVGAQAAVNGDFFSYNDYSTNGPSRGNGGAWGGADHGYVAPVQFGPGQVAIPPHEATGGVEAWAREVVSGHPSMLVGGARRDNNGDSLCTARHPRTALGFNADRTKLYLMVVDGRATGRAGMTCDEMIGQFQGLGATDAVNLDGGGSSTMWLAGAGVVNFPSDGSPRVVGNHLAIRATGGGDAPNCPVRRYEASAPAAMAPMEMTSGDESVVWLEMRNDGNVTWDVAQTRVGTQDPQDRDSAFFKDGNWVSPSRASGADHSTYAPGMVGRFTWVMVAPEVDVTTRFDETFQLVQEGVTWFGPKTTMSIVVHPRSGPTDPDAGTGGDGDGGSDPGADGDAGVDPGGDGSDSGGCSTGGGGGAGGGGGDGAWLALGIVAMSLVTRRRRE